MHGRRHAILANRHTTCGRNLHRHLGARSEEHTSELQSQSNLVCRLLLEKKKKKIWIICEEDNAKLGTGRDLICDGVTETKTSSAFSTNAALKHVDHDPQSMCCSHIRPV